ncbi:hypothetical protein PspLS_08346 [Pyricularia sp. CBS 133598]|nr:hypothetical protein PspLS_08346 [Pyricularia sp. CBS 133598]
MASWSEQKYLESLEKLVRDSLADRVLTDQPQAEGAEGGGDTFQSVANMSAMMMRSAYASLVVAEASKHKSTRRNEMG